MCSSTVSHVCLLLVLYQTMIKSFETGTNPVRCAKFIVRKQWIIAGTDDMRLRVYNYNTMEKVKDWEAHTDYIRFVEIHPNRPYILRYGVKYLVSGRSI
jgi:coatomer subunit beta'